MRIYYVHTVHKCTLTVFSGLQYFSKIMKSRKVEAVFLKLLGSDTFGWKSRSGLALKNIKIWKQNWWKSRLTFQFGYPKFVILANFFMIVLKLNRPSALSVGKCLSFFWNIILGWTELMLASFPVLPMISKRTIYFNFLVASANENISYN